MLNRGGSQGGAKTQLSRFVAVGGYLLITRLTLDLDLICGNEQSRGERRAASRLANAKIAVTGKGRFLTALVADSAACASARELGSHGTASSWARADSWRRLSYLIKIGFTKQPSHTPLRSSLLRRQTAFAGRRRAEYWRKLGFPAASCPPPETPSTL